MSDKVKIKTQISKIRLTGEVLAGECIEPSLINFFYGKNGTGKSTIAQQIGMPDHVDWHTGANPDDIKIEVYNEEYIRENVQSYGNIPGVFTITKQNADIKKAVDAKSEEIVKLESKISTVRRELEQKRGVAANAKKKFEEDVWSKTAEDRKRYEKALKGKGGVSNNKSKFCAELLNRRPSQIDTAALDLMYGAAFGQDAQRFSEYRIVPATSIPSCNLMEKAITSSADTDFSRFLQALNATAWVAQGHAAYQHMAGAKCPYCQSDLPATFETDLAACFDEQYKHDVAEVEAFRKAYRDALNGAHIVMSNNMGNGFECEQKALYSAKYGLFMEKAKANMELVKEKVADPSKVISLEDLSPVLDEIQRIADEINAQIQKNNAILDDRPGKQAECTDELWKHLASSLAPVIAVYQAEEKTMSDTISLLESKLKQYESNMTTLRDERSELEKQTVNTSAAKDSINALIKASGFQGFSLIEKPDAKYVYMLVRTNGKVADNLSEGERHFIAFLYYYHMVMGSQSDDGRIKDKIVVIDDPVSSMDSGALFTVATLVREMVNVCHNNFEGKAGADNHIRQFFCLTHNPYFFKEIAYNRIADFECVSIFELKKGAGNHSAIKPCTVKSGQVGGGKVNYSPVRNTYDALWDEYKKTDDPITLINVSRRILEYYFLQLCGYSDGDLKADLLEKNRDKFEVPRDDGSMDKGKYYAVAAMVDMLNAGARGFNDGLYFDVESIELDQIREAFKTIFDIRKQDRHYKMMMHEE